jgi:hypothetical protein
MFIRNKLAASSALVLVSLCGASSLVSAADTKPIVRETCTQATLVEFRPVGHPGKSIQLPKRQARDGESCSRRQHKPMMLASYTDARGGQALVRGKAERALEQIYAGKTRSYSVLELNNQCVAHTVLRQWSEAADACDAAVASALDKNAKGHLQFGGLDYSVDMAVATAYSNRAVMYWLRNDEVAAHNDLAMARKLAPQASYVLRNLNVAKTGSSLARAEDVRVTIG